jgi:hypothetical protein
VHWEHTGLAAQIGLLGFFMSVAHNPQGTAGRVVAQSPPRRDAESGAAGHAGLQSPFRESEARGHVMTSEPTLTGRWVSELLDTWQP